MRTAIRPVHELIQYLVMKIKEAVLGKMYNKKGRKSSMLMYLVIIRKTSLGKHRLGWRMILKRR
jgi:hypothetical protein